MSDQPLDARQHIILAKLANFFEGKGLAPGSWNAEFVERDISHASPGAQTKEYAILFTAPQGAEEQFQTLIKGFENKECKLINAYTLQGEAKHIIDTIEVVTPHKSSQSKGYSAAARWLGKDILQGGRR